MIDWWLDAVWNVTKLCVAVYILVKVAWLFVGNVDGQEEEY